MESDFTKRAKNRIGLTGRETILWHECVYVCMRIVLCCFVNQLIKELTVVACHSEAQQVEEVRDDFLTRSRNERMKREEEGAHHLL